MQKAEAASPAERGRAPLLPVPGKGKPTSVGERSHQNGHGETVLKRIRVLENGSVPFIQADLCQLRGWHFHSSLVLPSGQPREAGGGVSLTLLMRLLRAVG